MFKIQFLGYDKLREQLTGLARDQLPFATAKALTRIAQIGQAETSLQLRTKLRAPTRYATDSIFVKPATKAHLASMVYVKDSGITQKGGGKSQADVLGHLFSGGRRLEKNFEALLRHRAHLPAGWAAVPGAGCQLNAYGNIPPGFIVQLLAYFQAFGEQGYRANMDAKARTRFGNRIGKASGGNVQYFISRGKGNWFGGRSWKHGRIQKLPPGIWMRVSYANGGSAVKPVIMYVRTPTYKRYFNLPEIVQHAFERDFPTEFQEAMTEAIATAR